MSILNPCPSCGEPALFLAMPSQDAMARAGCRHCHIEVHISPHADNPFKSLVDGWNRMTESTTPTIDAKYMQVVNADLIPQLRMRDLVLIRAYQALRDNHGNRTDAALELGISVRGLGYHVRKLKDIGIDV